MRTTLEIDDALHERARRQAFEERRSIGAVISEWAIRGAGAKADTRPLGLFKGTIEIPEDFDEPLPEAIAAVESSLQ